MINRDLLNFNFENNSIDDIRLIAKSLLEKYKLSNILGINVFVDTQLKDDFITKKENVFSVFNGYFVNVPINVISQSPEVSMVAEVWTDDDLITLQHKCINDSRYSVFTNSAGTFIFALGLSASEYDLKLDQQSVVAFENMRKILEVEGFSFDDVIRQWNYIPDIIERITEAGEHIQNYQIFNDIREEYYRLYKKDTQYPAATGIGVNTGNVLVDFFAGKIHNNQQCVNLVNPRQIDAFDYSQEQLVGSAINKKPPLFSRAKFIGNYVSGQAYVSGTASIIGEETKGIDDVSLQTKLTIENIEKLISKENIQKVTGIEYKEHCYSFARVYIKEFGDFEKVKNICQEFFSDTQILFVKADICRENLLVEIECELELKN